MTGISPGEITYAADVIGALTAYTPVLTSNGTNPTLGTGGSLTQAGLWSRAGKLVYVTARIQFGTSGPAAGTGDYRVSLPTAASSLLTASGSLGLGTIVGSGAIRDNSAVSASRAVSVQLVSSTTVMMINGSGDSVGATVPWTWAASDAITIGVVYPID